MALSSRDLAPIPVFVAGFQRRCAGGDSGSEGADWLGASSTCCVRDHTEPQFGAGRGLPGDYPGDSLLRTSRGQDGRFNPRTVANLDERTDDGTDVRNGFSQNGRTGALSSATTDFRSGSRARSLSRCRFLCRSGSVSGNVNGESYDVRNDVRYGEDSDARPDARTDRRGNTGLLPSAGRIGVSVVADVSPGARRRAEMK